jgi:hypothetical protein
VEHLGGSILTSGSKHSVVICECQVIDFGSVDGLLVQNLARIKIVVNHMSVVGGNNQRLVAGTPHSSGKQVVFAALNFLDFFDFRANLHALLNSGKEVFEIVNTDVGALFVIIHAEELLIAKSEFYLL